MNQDNVIDLKKPEPFVDDSITAIIRQGARKLLAQALEAEIEFFINQYADLKDQLGRKRIVRNGYLPQREIQSGIETPLMVLRDGERISVEVTPEAVEQEDPVTGVLETVGQIGVIQILLPDGL